MKPKAAKHKYTSKKQSHAYVMYGFKKDEVDVAGYLGEYSNDVSKCRIPVLVQDIHDAQRFYDKNILNLSGYGTPEQWLDFWNTNEDNPYKFHLVKTTL